MSQGGRYLSSPSSSSSLSFIVLSFTLYLLSVSKLPCSLSMWNVYHTPPPRTLTPPASILLCPSEVTNTEVHLLRGQTVVRLWQQLCLLGKKKVEKYSPGNMSTRKECHIQNNVMLTARNGTNHSHFDFPQGIDQH